MNGVAEFGSRLSKRPGSLPQSLVPLKGPHGLWLAAGYFLALTVAALGFTLFSNERVFSNVERDLALQFVHWRKFGFDELRAGHLALWNPHIYGGTPYFGGFQSALLYPPNWLYLCLPLAVAINTGIALHLFLTGLGMFLWMRTRGLHWLAAVYAGTLFMFSGPVFPHIYAGHLSNLCTMTWAPFVFLSIDRWFQRRTAGWLLAGMAAISLQILAGHPQYVFYTGIAAALYCAAQLAFSPDRFRITAGLAVMALGAVALSAVQLLEGFHATGESVRSHGTSVEFAAIFSFPPENFLTALTPNFFGDLTRHPYWGRWNLWEMSLFFGASGLSMAIYGLVSRPRLQLWICAAIAAILCVLALGAYTPLFGWLFHHAPGFSRFRGWSKFTFPAVMLLIVLAATGFDRLLRRGVLSSRPGLLVLSAGVVLCAGAMWARHSARTVDSIPPQPWNAWIHALSETNDQYLAAEQIDKPSFIRKAARQATRQLWLAGVSWLVLGSILLLARRYPTALTALPAIGAFEMLCFARTTLDTFPLRDVLAPPETGYLAASAKEGFRVNDERSHNLAMSLRAYDLWGYDPGVTRRYAEFMSASQDRDPGAFSESMKLDALPPNFAGLLRYRYRIAPSGKSNVTAVEPTSPPSSRLMLVPQARIITERDDELDQIFSLEFDASRTVVLETAPHPAPVGGPSSGVAKLVGETSDSLTVEADLPFPEILVITDAYSDGWQARSLLPAAEAGGSQARYEVLPGDYCFRAVPLAAGHHKILLEYRPAAFVVGKWMSLIALGLYGVAVAIWASNRFRRTPQLLATSPHR